MGKSTINAMFGFMAGLAVGTAAGVLFAPEKGTETRKKIKDTAHKLNDEMRDNFAGKLDNLSDLLSDFVKETKSKITEIEQKAQKEVHDVKGKVAK